MRQKYIGGKHKMGYFISELSYGELNSLLTDDSVIVLPIGGGSKEHGNHLPMGTDYFVTSWVAEQVTKRKNVFTLPTLPYAYFPAFVEWKGSVSVDKRIFADYVEEILTNFVKYGIWKFLIIDGGVSTHPPLVFMARDMFNKYNVYVGVSNIRELGKETELKVCSQKRGGHGDEAETSTLLYIRPDLVHMDQTTEEYLEPFPGTVLNGRTIINMAGNMNTPHGTNGNSTLATRDKGEAIMEAYVDEICGFLDTFIPMKREK